MGVACFQGVRHAIGYYTNVITRFVKVLLYTQHTHDVIGYIFHWLLGKF